MIWFVAPDSYAASNAASSGAFVLSESYLYTQEMLEQSLEHLTPDGMVVMQFGEKDYDRRAEPDDPARVDGVEGVRRRRGSPTSPTTSRWSPPPRRGSSSAVR